MGFLGTEQVLCHMVGDYLLQSDWIGWPRRRPAAPFRLWPTF
jgi:hypothetical protein